MNIRVSWWNVFVVLFLVGYVVRVGSWMSTSPMSVCVTGGTGVLGKALVRGLLSRPGPLEQLYFTSRTPEEASRLLQELSVVTKLVPTCLPLHIAGDRQDELCEQTAFPRLSLPLLSTMLHSPHKVVINNLATCLPGHSHEALYRSVLTNSLAPMQLALEVLENSSEADLITVINVSSGDGERIFLHSSLQQALDAITTPAQLVQYATFLLQHYHPQLEYSFGDTPMYSLSKALLNKATEVIHHHFTTRRHVRIVSICPGNFLSSMTRTAEEVAESTSHAALSMQTVANYVLQAIDPMQPYVSGRFYRYGKEISF